MQFLKRQLLCALHQHEQCMYVTLMHRCGYVCCLMLLYILYVLALGNHALTVSTATTAVTGLVVMLLHAGHISPVCPGRHQPA